MKCQRSKGKVCGKKTKGRGGGGGNELTYSATVPYLRGSGGSKSGPAPLSHFLSDTHSCIWQRSRREREGWGIWHFKQCAFVALQHPPWRGCMHERGLKLTNTFFRLPFSSDADFLTNVEMSPNPSPGDVLKKKNQGATGDGAGVRKAGSSLRGSLSPGAIKCFWHKLWPNYLAKKMKRKAAGGGGSKAAVASEAFTCSSVCFPRRSRPSSPASILLKKHFTASRSSRSSRA